MHETKADLTASAKAEAPRVRFVTLGCKVNQYETQGMRESLCDQGVVEDRLGRDCDFVVINTCTVTSEADRENRYWIRRMRREHPAAKIVVTGCYVERNRSEIESMSEVDLVLSNHQKDEIASRLIEGCGAPAVQDSEAIRRKKRQFTPLKISSFQGMGRAFVKIQDGCNHACSFCKVVMVRGRSRSREISQVLEEIVRLRDAGYREVVFAGIQLGAYGLDLGSQDLLMRLLEKAAAIEGIERLRLSSIEPTDVTPELIEVMRGIPKCCPHLHIPLQSGDDEVLRSMNRRYGREFYADLVRRLKEALPDFSLTLDVMAGFPGETDAGFENTCSLLREIKPLKSHVFPYSRREGTRAAAFEDVPPGVIRMRVETLLALGESLGRQERAAYTGREYPVLIEKYLPARSMVQGLTANYLKVYFAGEASEVGSLVPVKLLSLQNDAFLGARLAGFSGQVSCDSAQTRGE